MKKSTAIALFPLALLAALPSARAEVVLLGDQPAGWRFTTDGSVNAFAVNTNPGSAPTGTISRAGGTIAGNAGTSAGNSDSTSNFRVREGLLPANIGFNVKSPDLEGNKVAARIGIYPNIQNANTANSFSGQADFREAFFTVDGTWGQIMAGKSLSQFQSANLLDDMTLFGVGAPGGASGGGTTLGRIGHGYVYAQFNSNIRYTTPDLSGFKGSLGLYDPSKIQDTSGTAAGSAATITQHPRVESELSYAEKFNGVDFTEFVSGMWQDAQFVNGTSALNGTKVGGNTVTADGIAGGVKIGYGPVTVVASGFSGQALGSTLMLDADSLDRGGKERKSRGYYVQGQYAFGQGTSLGLSYGGNYMKETTADAAARVAGTAVEVKSQELLSAQLSHNINKYFRVVGEFDNVNNAWFDGKSRSEQVFAVGGFVFW